jgi:hypothetical protein
MHTDDRHRPAPPTAARARIFRRAIAPAVLLLSAAAGPCAPDPKGEMDMAQGLLETQDAVIDLRNDAADLQAEIDSLRDQIQFQDSVIRVLANLAGRPLPISRFGGPPPP